jgi:hypothetical protein
VDIAILLDAANVAAFEGLLADLDAELIAVPPFNIEYLSRGHAVHFRCKHVEAAGIRLDVMSKMRGVDPFEDLWARRTTFETDGQICEVMALPDLVRAKKTQRDKDWPMIRRLVEANYFEGRSAPTGGMIEFWFRELRTPELLIDLAKTYPVEAGLCQSSRPLIEFAIKCLEDNLSTALLEEEQRERQVDRAYWSPLRSELEALRHASRPGNAGAKE